MPSELEQFLAEDTSARVLFVEGETDILIWRHICPIAVRINTVVYSMSSIDLAVPTGGNKERAIQLAKNCALWPEASRQRVWFFLDSDCDRFLNVTYPQLVSVTDGRDMESYVLHGSLLSCMCELGAGKRSSEAALLSGAISKLLRPIGFLRIASAQQGWQLPFQNTFQSGSVKRFFRETRGVFDLRLSNLIDALLDQADISRSNKESIEAELSSLMRSSSTIPDWQVVHGKDLVALFAWYFDIPLNISAGLLALSLTAQAHELSSLASFGYVDAWLRAA